jgi:uncharacterized protein
VSKPLVVNAVELLRRPGSTKDIDVVVSAEDCDFNDTRIDDEAVHVRLHLEALSDGIAVTGTASAHWHGECRRCLHPVSETADVGIDELYQLAVSDPDAYLIENDQLNLLPMVRENILIAVPLWFLCRSDCAGLCPECGTDLNIGSCSCRPPATDDRWSALEELKRRLSEETPGDPLA